MRSSAEAVEAARDRLRWDTPFWAKHCAVIKNEDAQPVPLIARPWQESFDAALEKQRAGGRPMRAIVLKARKLGFSTWVQTKFMQRVTQNPYQYALVAAQDNKTASVLADMAELMYANLPSEEALGLGFSVKPQLIASARNRSGGRFLQIGDRMRPTEASMYETLTAGAKGAGRGYTPRMLHGSEVAHWEDPDFLVGLLNSVPKRPETIVVLESTANGFNHFYERWQRAKEGAEDPDTGGLYLPLFYGWQDNPHNSLPFPSDLSRDRFERTIGDPDGGGDEEEVELIEAFGVTLEQLFWRRITRDEECGGSLDMLHQEHPATDVQAFVGSGKPVFPGILVSRMIREAEKAREPVTGVLRADEVAVRRTRSGTIEVPESVVWVPETAVSVEDEDVWMPPQRLLVWEHPLNAESQAGLQQHERRPDGQYIVFVDVAQGAGTASDEADYSAIQVLDHMSRVQVARYRSRVPVHELPLIAFLVATYYNQAWLAVEKNNMGIGVVDSLVKDYRYRFMYRTRRAGDDERADSKQHLFGWLTSLQSKPLMEQTFAQALKEGSHGLRDVVTGREFTTYVKDPKNGAKHGAQRGAFDDLAVSFMGVHRVAAELKPREPRRGSGRVRGFRVDDPITGA